MGSVPDFQPLYKQVYNVLVGRIAEGSWRPSEVLPSEQALAAELGVSQGTVRKALDALAAEQLVERRQGKGTYVAQHTQERSLFRFFRMARSQGERVTPESNTETAKRRKVRPSEAKLLDLDRSAMVVEINRTRLIDEVPAIAETIIIPLSLFPDIDKRGELPNTLYSLYQLEYGVSVATAEEELNADIVTKADARRLKLPEGSAVLKINRVAIAVDGRRVELRKSRCDTRNLVYAVSVK